MGAGLLHRRRRGSAAQASLPRDLDAEVARALRLFQVPGMAIAVVKDGKILLARGYGVRRMGDAAPVDANTYFQIASNTKAFTTALLAQLVDSGRLAWDDPVTKYLPWFQLWDPWVKPSPAAGGSSARARRPRCGRHKRSCRSAVSPRRSPPCGPTSRPTAWDGRLAGMTSRTLLVPDLKLGIVMLANAEQPVYAPLAFELLDHFLGAPRTDWITHIHDVLDQGQARADSVQRSQGAQRDTASRPSLPLARYAGAYTDALYGDATLTLEGDHLVLRFSHSPAFVGDLRHWQYDTFVAHWRSAHIEDAFVTFALEPDGAIERFTMAAVSPLADFSFDYQDLRFVPVRGP